MLLPKKSYRAALHPPDGPLGCPRTPGQEPTIFLAAACIFQCLERPVWKGVLRLATAVIHGLELSVTTNTTGGMASAFHLLEIAHTHYWHREIYRKPSISSLVSYYKTLLIRNKVRVYLYL